MRQFVLLLIGIVAMFFGTSFSYAVDCNDGYFAVDDTCVESKFQIKTIKMEANTTFSFYLTAKGTFYVDWGDGNSQTITRTSITETLYSHTYTNASNENGWYIQFGGRASGYNNSDTFNPNYPAIRFYTGTINRTSNSLTGTGTEIYINKIYGSIGAIFSTIGTGASLANQPVFFALFAKSVNLSGEIPRNLFVGVSGVPKIMMFYSIFSGCTNLSGEIPEGLFADVTGTMGRWMFAYAFNGCTNLTGKIPSNLFIKMTGVPTGGAFAGTFQNCRNLTGNIPKNLFKNLSGAIQDSTFRRTFYNCSGLSGFVPPELFATITDSNQTNRMSEIFSGSGLVNKCPCGYKQVITGFESYWSGKVACEIGFKEGDHWNNGICVQDCDAGFNRLNTATGQSFYVLNAKTSDLSIVLKYNDKKCYVPTLRGISQLNFNINGEIYHATLPDEVVSSDFIEQQ